MTPEEIDVMFVLLRHIFLRVMMRVHRYKKMQEKKRQSAAAVSQSVEEDGGEEMQRDPSSAGPGDYEPAVVTGRCFLIAHAMLPLHLVRSIIFAFSLLPSPP